MKKIVVANRNYSPALSGVEALQARLLEEVELLFLAHLQGSEEENLFEEILNDSAEIALISAVQLPYPLPETVEIYALWAPENTKQQIGKEHIGSSADVLSGVLAIVGKSNNSDFKELFGSVDERKKWGKVEIVGFGAGNYNLLTVKGLELLTTADAILYDDLIDNDYLVQFKGEKIYVGKRKGNHSFEQRIINELIYSQAIEGKHVVRIKGGDPLLFGRGAEEYHYVKSRFIEAEITPGITSAFAAASQYVISLTDRDLASSLTILSGHNIDKLKVPKSDTLVFYMGASKQQEIAQKLIAEGHRPDTPVAIVKDASYAHSQAVRLSLEELAQKSTSLGSPAIIIVGEVARLGNKVRKRWLYTGTTANDFDIDGIVIHSPLIAIAAEKSTPEIENTLTNLNEFNRIIFTSPYAVQHFFNHLFSNNLDVRALSMLAIMAVGKTTSEELKKYGLMIAPMSNNSATDGVLKYCEVNKIKKERILIPSSSVGQGTLPDELRGLGNYVISLALYRNTMPEAVVKHDLLNFEGVVFTSPSTVTNFVRLYGLIPAHLKIISRGADTQKRIDALYR